MTVDRGYVKENDAQRERLKTLVRRASDAELSQPMPAGWTPAAMLGHLAFWDQRIAVVVEQWQRAGAAALPAPVDGSAVDWINDAAKPMLLALAPRRAAEVAVAAAEAADAAVATLPDAFLAANQEAGGRIMLVRAHHRREHLDEIERVLAAR